MIDIPFKERHNEGKTPITSLDQNVKHRNRDLSRIKITWSDQERHAKASCGL